MTVGCSPLMLTVVLFHNHLKHGATAGDKFTLVVKATDRACYSTKQRYTTTLFISVVTESDEFIPCHHRFIFSI